MVRPIARQIRVFLILFQSFKIQSASRNCRIHHQPRCRNCLLRYFVLDEHSWVLLYYLRSSFKTSHTRIAHGPNSADYPLVKSVDVSAPSAMRSSGVCGSDETKRSLCPAWSSSSAE